MRERSKDLREHPVHFRHFAQRVIAAILVFVLAMAGIPGNLQFKSKFVQTVKAETNDKQIPEDAETFNGHSYYLYKNTTNSWDDAESYCESVGGYLAVITSEDENNFIHNYVISAGYSRANFGLSDHEEEGSWRWVNGEELTYTNWHSGEPNSQNSKEDFALYYFGDGTWNDGGFDSPVYVCEWNEEGSGSGTGGEYTHTPSNTITEDMLFTPEYAQYLNNEAYFGILSSITSDMAEACAAQKWDDFSIVYKTLLSAGSLGSGKIVLLHALGSLTKKDYREEKVAEAMAMEYINGMNSCSDYSMKVYSKYVSVVKKCKDVLGVKKDVTSLKEDDIELVASQLDKQYKTTFLSSKKKQIKNDLSKLSKDKETLTNIKDVLKTVDLALTSFDIIMYIETLKLTDEEIYYHYEKMLSDINERYYAQYGSNYSSSYRLLKGIKKNRQRLQEGDIITFAKKFFVQKGLGEILGLIAEHVTAGKVTGVGALEVIDLCFTVGDLFMSHYGAIDVDDYLKVQYAMCDQMYLLSGVNDIRIMIRKGEGDPEKLRQDYQDLLELYISCVIKTGDYLKNYTNDFWASKISNDIAKNKSQLTYENYIKSCLKNANATYNYTVSDGRATITGSGDKKNTKSISLDFFTIVANAADIESYCIDIPSEIDGYPVEAIAKEAYSGDSSIFALHIPESLTIIDDGAFKGCSNLSSVYLSPSLEEIRTSAFEGCYNLGEIDIPDTVSEIQQNAFDAETVIKGSSGSAGETYAELSGSSFTAKEKALESLEVTQNPDKTYYGMSEDPDLTGIKLKAYFTDGTNAIIEKDYAGVFLEKKIGTIPMAICYGGIETTIDVSMHADTCKYQVYYLDEYGKQIHDPYVGEASGGSSIKLDLPEIEGYICEEEQVTKTILGNETYIVDYKVSPKQSVSDADISYTKLWEETGKEINPEIKVVLEGKQLEEGTDYTVEYENNIEPGTATIWVVGINDYDGCILCDFTIKGNDTSEETTTEQSQGNNNSNKEKIQKIKEDLNKVNQLLDLYKRSLVTNNRQKKSNPLTAKAVKKTVKYSELKKKSQSYNLIKVTGAKGTVRYKITGGNKKSKKAIKINKNTGKITVKKKAKKGTYKVKVKVSAAGNSQYKAGSKTVKVSVRVK